MRTLLLLLIPFIGFGQRQLDTIPVIMLVSDTTIHKDLMYYEGYPCDDSCVHADDEFHMRPVYREYRSPIICFYIIGYKVGEIHNEAEGVIDPGFYTDVVWKDYLVCTGYLDDEKNPLSPDLIVWQTLERK